LEENNSSRLRSSLSPEKRGKLAQSLSAARPPSCLCGVTPRQAAKPEKTVEKLPDQLPTQLPEQLPEKLPTVDAEEACNSEKSALVTTDAQLEEQSLEETMIVETAWYEDLAKKDNEQNLAEIVAQDSTVEESEASPEKVQALSSNILASKMQKVGSADSKPKSFFLLESWQAATCCVRGRGPADD